MVDEAQHPEGAGKQVHIELGDFEAGLEVGVHTAAAGKAGNPVTPQVGGASQGIGLVKAEVAEVVGAPDPAGPGQLEGEVGGQVKNHFGRQVGKGQLFVPQLAVVGQL